jgi:phosphoglucosamine mutase
MKIVVDCANGATYHVAPHVFRELGAEVIELSVDPDGFNINQACGSTNPDLLKKIVLAEEANLGIALDGDGDRVIMVDHKGEVLDGDELLYIIAKYCQIKHQSFGGVVGTVMSNMGLETALNGLSIPFIRAKVGDRYVISELQKQGWLLGGEPSGHVVWLGATTTGDGIITALQVLAAMCEAQKNLNDLKHDLHKYPQVIKNISISNKENFLKHPSVEKAIKNAELELAKKGRVLLRPSGTEPVIRIMVEGENENVVHSIAEKLAEVVSSI